MRNTLIGGKGYPTLGGTAKVEFTADNLEELEHKVSTVFAYVFPIWKVNTEFRKTIPEKVKEVVDGVKIMDNYHGSRVIREEAPIGGESKEHIFELEKDEKKFEVKYDELTSNYFTKLQTTDSGKKICIEMYKKTIPLDQIRLSSVSFEISKKDSQYNTKVKIEEATQYGSQYKRDFSLVQKMKRELQQVLELK